MYNDKKKILVKNTFMLYVLRFSSYFFGFISVPYQTRILGTVIYGKIGIATAFMLYFQLFLDFGFILSATEKVSRNKGNNEKLCDIYTSVTYIKIIFSIISFFILLCICNLFEQYDDKPLYLWFFLSTVASALVPDFLYRGLEDMSPITYRTVGTRAVFTILIFVFLKKPEDYLAVPVLTFLGNAAGLIWSCYDVKKRYQIKVKKPNKCYIREELINSSTFFLSRIANTVYTATNTIILGLIDPVGITVGLYTAAYKLVSTGQSALSPIADSVYPYMIQNRDFGLIKKILKICMPVIFFGCIIIWIFAEQICGFFFGEDFSDAGMILRAMIPSVFVTLPEYLFGFPSLSAIGKTKYANYSIYFSTCVHLVLLLILFKMNKLSAVTLAILVSVAGINDTVYRLIVIIRNKHLMSEIS